MMRLMSFTESTGTNNKMELAEPTETKNENERPSHENERRLTRDESTREKGQNRPENQAEEPKITRRNIVDLVVDKPSRQSIEEFLSYKVRPGAGNLTIGLKKLIFLARVFLEEPSFVILEENAIDFDELNNHFFFDVLKVS